MGALRGLFPRRLSPPGERFGWSDKYPNELPKAERLQRTVLSGGTCLKSLNPPFLCKSFKGVKTANVCRFEWLPFPVLHPVKYANLALLKSPVFLGFIIGRAIHQPPLLGDFPMDAVKHLVKPE